MREPVERRHTWDALVLPQSELELLRRLGAELRSRLRAGARARAGRRAEPARGLAVFFSGPPGTGKTTAALMLAADTGVPFSRVDLSDISLASDLDDDQLLERIFPPASNSEGVLFLSPADMFLPSYVGAARRPAAARELSLGVVVERARHCPGVVIFASRQTRRLEPELAEQFDFVVSFPFPDSGARREIWRRYLPRDSQVSEENLDHLALSFKLPGAAIRRCCLAAAHEGIERQVPVSTRHLARALEHEYRDRIVTNRTRAALDALRISSTPARGDAPAGVESSPPVARVLPGARTLPGPRTFPGTRAWLPVASGIVLAAVLGFVIARSNGSHASPAPLDQRTSAGLIAVKFPSTWRPHPRPGAGSSGLTDGLSLASASRSGATLVIGRTDASEQRPLPSEAVAVLHGTPAPQIVTLGGMEFYRYRSASTAGGPASQIVYTLPTTSGTIVAVCTPRGAEPSASDCERILATIRLTSGTVLQSRVSPDYVAALNATTRKLNTVRLSAGSRLRTARNAAVQAAVARELGAAHLAAAATLERLSAGPATAANAALVKALRATGAAYAALASAAAHHDSRSYGAARNALNRVVVTLNTAFTEVSKFT